MIKKKYCVSPFVITFLTSDLSIFIRNIFLQLVHVHGNLQFLLLISEMDDLDCCETTEDFYFEWSYIEARRAERVWFQGDIHRP